MSNEPRTPRWWRSLPTWIQVLVLVSWLPGAVAHELIHALVAHRWSDWRFDWDAIAVRYDWATDHPAPRAATQIAPLVVGLALTVGLLATVAGQPGTIVGAGIGAYIGLNLAILTAASAADLVGFAVAVWAWATGQRYHTQQEETPHA